MATEVAADGSPVPAYAALPAEPELSVVRRHLRGARTIVDLGCGTGRIADPLAVDGFEVVGVDDSAEMLAQVRHAATVRCRIETLQLDRRFDVVLLLSQLVNSAAGDRFLSAAARHVSSDGRVLIQRLVPGRPWVPGSVRVGEVTISIDDIEIHDVWVRATTTYLVGDRSWRQPWQLRERSDVELSSALERVGLRATSMDGAWVLATASTPWKRA